MDGASGSGTGTSSAGSVGGFAETRWSLVRACGDGSGDGERARKALGELMEAYWYPLYAFARRGGASAQDAEDLVQGFMARAVERGTLERASEARGRFRSFLLTSFRNFVSNEQKAARAQKRRPEGGWTSIDVREGEARYRREPCGGLTPERLYERKWATELLAEGFRVLREDYEATGKGAVFEGLKGYLAGDAGPSYVEVGEELGMAEGAVKVAVFRMRKRFGQVVRGLVADTVGNEGEQGEEILALFRAFD